jgi:hypothetical protein
MLWNEGIGDGNALLRTGMRSRFWHNYFFLGLNASSICFLISR